MSVTYVYATEPGGIKRLLHTITHSSRYNSSPTLENLDRRDRQEEQAQILIEGWRRSGAKNANTLYEVDQSSWRPALASELAKRRGRA